MKGSNSHRLKTAVQRPVAKAPLDLVERLVAAPAWLRSVLALAISLLVVLLVGSLWLYVAA